ncbi:VPLPA-CTERM sorting domain-containing protein [Pseudooceanicola sp. LIPI14-2-Ac024]|uniref:VPLPA-CTERM sorting domain-containing protein n=1 Tax=Pseudooceanicola sp. LIPI14-2-Ac024 TaxID=3344875 RepID=UPI0035D05EED
MFSTRTILAGGTALVLGAGAAQAAHLSYYEVTLSELNNSGVSGGGTLEYNSDTMQLVVEMSVKGLFPGQRHMAHIHGTPGADSVLPDMSDDADGDGYIEVLEAVGKYGDVMLNLSDPATGMFPMAPGLGGMLSFSYTYDLSVEVDGDPTNDILMGLLGSYTLDDFGPEMLEMREIVFHGDMITAAGGGAPGAGTSGEIDGTVGFKPLLPVAAGEIRAVAPVPLPAGLPLLAVAIGALGWMRRSSRS